MPTEAKRPLEGIKVLDLGRAIAAPYCAQMLADMGADVIKIERPGITDEMRAYPPFMKDNDGAPTTEGHGYMAVNRNKKAITLDLSKPAAQEILKKLAKNADVLIENYKVGDLKRYGLDYDAIREINPRIIYCSITGYGQSGPYARRPGFDSVFQAMSGVMSVTGDPAQPPQRVGYIVSDVTAGMTAAQAVLGALYWRDVKGGTGQHIDISLVESQIAAMGVHFTNYLLTGTVPRRAGVKTAGAVIAQPFPCSDGMLQISAQRDEEFARFAHTIGRADLAEDERFRTRKGRVENEEALVAILNPILEKDTRANWSKKFEANNIIHSPIYAIDEVLEDEHIKSRDIVVSVEHPLRKDTRLVRNPIRYSESVLDKYAPPPLAGQHNEDVYKSLLGLSDEELEQLKAESTI